MRKHKFKTYLARTLTVMMLLSLTGQNVVTVAADDTDAEADAVIVETIDQEVTVSEETVVQENSITAETVDQEETSGSDGMESVAQESQQEEVVSQESSGTEDGFMSDVTLATVEDGEDDPESKTVEDERILSADEVTSEEENSEDTETEADAIAWNQESISGSSSASGVTVSVTAPVGSFPEGTELKINPISGMDAASYLEAVATNRPAEGFDISFEYEGSRVQPAAGSAVELTFFISGSSSLLETTGSLDVYHIGDQADRLGSVNISESGKDAAITVYADSFSPFVIVNAGSPVATRARTLAKVSATTAESYEPKEVNVVLSNLTVASESSEGTHPEDRVNVRFNWDASSYGTDLHEGDYFIVELPAELNYTKSVTLNDFDLTNGDNNNLIVYGRATVNKSEGTITATFNEKVENRYGVAGTMWFQARVNSTITTGKPITFTVSAGVSASTVDVTIIPKNDPGDDEPGELALWKVGGHVDWGTDYEDTGVVTQANWNINVKNETGDYLHSIVIKDHLKGQDNLTTTEKYIAGTFRISPVDYYEGYYARWDGSRKYYSIDDCVVFGDDMQSFVLTLPNEYEYTNGSFIIEYKTTFDSRAGKRLFNYAEFSSTEITKADDASVRAIEGGGTATGNIANRIKLVKVDSEDDTITLAGAEFEVKKPNGETFTLTTGSDGTVTSSVLEQGEYTIKETTAPTGYALDETPFTITLTADGVVKTITNDRIKTEINVTKKWEDADDQDGLRPEKIIVKLLADEEDTGKTLTLNAENQWQGSFTDLNTHAAGEAISYSVEEVEVNGYDSVITGNPAEGYVITNTHTPEMIEVEGVKEWKDNDNKNDKRPERIEINLLADDEKIDSTSVTGDDDWTFRFTDLPKYRDQGTAIVYTIEETVVAGYTTSITGDAESGFVVTNTEKPEESKEEEPKDPEKPEEPKKDDPKKTEDPKEDDPKQPEDPKEEDPKDPEKPEESKKDEPTRPGTQNPQTNTNRTTVTTRSNNTAPVTGDAGNLALWITVMLLSMGALLYFVNYRKKNHK